MARRKRRGDDEPGTQAYFSGWAAGAGGPHLRLRWRSLRRVGAYRMGRAAPRHRALRLGRTVAETVGARPYRGASSTRRGTRRSLVGLPTPEYPLNDVHSNTPPRDCRADRPE